MRVPLLFAIIAMSACAGRYHTEPVGDPLQTRLDIALRTRAQLSYYLVQQGAVARPPMPVQIAEARGAMPFDGAQWNTGSWAWVNGRWEWQAGYWTEPDVFTSIGPSVAVGGTVENESIDAAVGLATVLVDALLTYGAKRDHHAVRDHRSSSSSSSSSSSATWKSNSSPDANVRDHR